MHFHWLYYCLYDVIINLIVLLGAIVNFIAYFIIGLPLGIVLGFKTDLRLLGIWIGMLVGNVSQVRSCYYCGSACMRDLLYTVCGICCRAYSD